jgi:NAD+ diphosphatase
VRALEIPGRKGFFAAEWPDRPSVEGGFELAPLRSLFGVLEDETVLTAGLGSQMIYWDRAHRFCGRCGGRTEDKIDERAKICPDCGLLNYPRLSPAVIVAVVRDDRILLARNQRFKRSFYSVLAGFVEPGETLEQCVGREVLEEAGIRVENIRYFGSQPWPFPDSLMIGFTADYAGGRIRTDGEEIADAGWFAAGRLPAIPPRLSIARQLIDWFVDRRPAVSPKADHPS